MRGLLSVIVAVSALAWPGTVPAGFDDGVKALKRNDRGTAFREFRAAADTGHAGAQYYLGRMYLIGEGVDASYKKAAELFRLAAAQGHVNAQFYLGVLHYLGDGVAQSYAEALNWYEAAAAQGDAMSRYYLGVMHAAGEGVERDYVRAYFWFTLSADVGNETAAKFRTLIAQRMTDADIADAKGQVRRWKRQRQ